MIRVCAVSLKRITIQETSCCWGGPTVPSISEGQHPTSGRRRKRFLIEWLHCHVYVMVPVLYRMLQSTLR